MPKFRPRFPCSFVVKAAMVWKHAVATHDLPSELSEEASRNLLRSMRIIDEYCALDSCFDGSLMVHWTEELAQPVQAQVTTFTPAEYKPVFMDATINGRKPNHDYTIVADTTITLI
jgi:hypothetical protein